MSHPHQAKLRNRLLSLMQPEDFALLAPHLEPVELPRKFIMVEEDREVERVFFLESGIGSVVATSPEGHEVECGIFGREGLSPVAAVLGIGSVRKREFMQVAGKGYAIDRMAFANALEGSPTLRTMLDAYAYTMLVQAHFTTLSNAVHPVDERLARWLLMCDDRSEGMEIALTHDFISIMLAVRRPSVTTALHVLEGNGFIRSERGVVIIRDRKRMELFARDAYGVPEAEYGRLIGSMS